MSTMTNGGWLESIPAVDIELLDGGTVRVTDKSDPGQDYSVDLHPIHLRLIAERLGLMATVSDTEAQALRMVDKLVRRMGVLHERILQLDRWLWDQTDFEDANIETEIWFSAATLELSNEFRAEIAEAGYVSTPRRTESVPGNNPVGSGQQTQAKPKGNPVGSSRPPVKFKGAKTPPTSLFGDEGSPS